MAAADAAAGILMGATPLGAIAGGLASALGTTPSSASNAGPNSAGPVSVNVSGFGGWSSGSPSSNAQQSTPGSYGFTPSSGALPGWVMPVVILVGLGVVALALKR